MKPVHSRLAYLAASVQTSLCPSPQAAGTAITTFLIDLLPDFFLTISFKCLSTIEARSHNSIVSFLLLNFDSKASCPVLPSLQLWLL